jgi:hypothetical protein
LALMKIIDATYASSKSGSSIAISWFLLHSLVTFFKLIYLIYLNYGQTI